MSERSDSTKKGQRAEALIRAAVLGAAEISVARQEAGGVMLERVPVLGVDVGFRREKHSHYLVLAVYQNVLSNAFELNQPVELSAGLTDGDKLARGN